MIKADTAREIMVLHQRKMSQHAIALITGVSRDTIRKIIRGQHKGPTGVGMAPFGSTVGRCPRCRCRVKLPCYACRIRNREVAD